MTISLPVSEELLVSRCQTIEAAFQSFEEQLTQQRHAQPYEMNPAALHSSGLRISRKVLFDSVLHYFRDLNRYKQRNGFETGERANAVKVGAFTMYWLCTKRPIYDGHDTDYAAVINDRFAVFAGLIFAEIEPYAATEILDGRPYRMLLQLLADGSATSDGIVPIFELLAHLCPSK